MSISISFTAALFGLLIYFIIASKVVTSVLFLKFHFGLAEM